MDDSRTSVERLLAKSREDPDSGNGRLSERARHRRRSVEAYLKAGVRPRWMERLVEIDRGIAVERRRIARSYRALQEECAADAELFARRWRGLAVAWRFDGINELIRQHNAWYPIERDLPMDLRTRDFVQVGGRSYRRAELGPEWILEQFPADRAGGTVRR